MPSQEIDYAQAHLREIVADLQPGEAVELTDHGRLDAVKYLHPKDLTDPATAIHATIR